MAKIIIDLTKPSDFCTISTYPDGQISAKIDFFKILGINNDSFEIRSRMSSYQDLFKILAVNDVLKYHHFKRTLFVPYFLGARSDRRFGQYESFDLKLVTDIINSCGFQYVTVLDPHSDVLTALLDNCMSNSAYWWIYDVEYDWIDKVLISPDAGAYKKIFSLSEKLKCELMSGSKVRIPDGSPQVVIHGDVKDKDCVIVDDICDGGRTFIELGKLLRERGARTVTLFVTHGIFSKGIQLENIDAVYTTNSYQPFDETMQTDYFHFVNVF